MHTVMAVVDESTLRNAALWVTGGSVVVGVLLMALVRSIVGKLMSAVFFSAIAVAAFTQRQAIVDCVDKVRGEVNAANPLDTKIETSCTFFGRDISLNVTP
jgi:SNF family Na+-dependent transporter